MKNGSYLYSAALCCKLQPPQQHSCQLRLPSCDQGLLCSACLVFRPLLGRRCLLESSPNLPWMQLH